MKDSSECLVMTVPEAGRVLGLGRNAAYEAARRGELPTIRIGRLIRVPKEALKGMLDVPVQGRSAYLVPLMVGDVLIEK
jgi:excisionase family DNA binding protein